MRRSQRLGRLGFHGRTAETVNRNRGAAAEKQHLAPVCFARRGAVQLGRSLPWPAVDDQRLSIAFEVRRKKNTWVRPIPTRAHVEGPGPDNLQLDSGGIPAFAPAWKFFGGSVLCFCLDVLQAWDGLGFKLDAPTFLHQSLPARPLLNFLKQVRLWSQQTPRT